MAVDVTLNNITSGYNVSKINTNFQRIETALQDAVSRSGDTPNQMEADLDLNSNDLLNVGVLNAENAIIDGINLGDELDTIIEASADAVAAAATAVSAANTAVASSTVSVNASVTSVAASQVALASANTAVAAAEASGPVVFYNTKALANAAVAGLPANQIVEVFADESRGGFTVRYRKEGGVLVFKLVVGLLEMNAIANNVPVDGVTDAGPSMNALFARSDFNKVELGRTYPEGAGSGGMLIDTMVTVPWYKHLRGEGRESRIYVKNTPTPSILFALNTNGAGSWLTPFPGPMSSHIGGMFINASNLTDSGTQITAFEFGGSQKFRDIHAGGVQTLARQINQYCDHVEFRNVMTYGQPTTNNYFIDLQAEGDGVVIDQCHFYRRYTDGADGAIDPSTGKRSRGIILKYKAGATISNNIGGDTFIDSSINVDVSNLHNEDGIVTFQDSTGVLRNSVFYMRGDGRGEISTTPVQVSYSTSSSAKSGVVTFENLEFRYEQGFPGGYTITKPNFNIKNSPTTFNGVVHVRDLNRDFISAIGGFQTQRFGVNCGLTDFDNYSHIASVCSDLYGGNWHINGKIESLPSTEGGIDTTNSTLANEGIFTGASNTYFYKVQLLYDKIRLIGITGSNEKSLAVVNGASSPSIVLNTTFRRQAIYRVYRGTVTNSYDNYVDVPATTLVARLIDNGGDIAGYPWVARTAGPVDVINAMSVVGYELKTGEFNTASNAYGNVTVHVRGNATIPTVGSWRRGDKVVVLTGPEDDSRQFYGWTRKTDCLTASPTHVNGVDWIQDWIEFNHPAASATSFNNAAYDINVNGKSFGSMYWDSTTQKPLWASGSSPTSPWKDATGATIYTPS